MASNYFYQFRVGDDRMIQIGRFSGAQQRPSATLSSMMRRLSKVWETIAAAGENGYLKSSLNSETRSP